MYLSELEPRWVAEWGAPLDAKQGISFLCPCCRQIKLAIFFDKPISPETQPANLHRNCEWVSNAHLTDHHVGGILWERTGESFENLTLLPSIDASSFGHWHGFIRNGEIV